MGQFFADLKNRGIIKTISDEQLERLLDSDYLVFYSGYDPTASSLQLGNLFAIITMKRLQMAGHKPVILVGGATGMIGDPSGKSAERVLLDENTIEANCKAIKDQLVRFLDFDCGKNSAVMVNNLDWFKDLSFLDFMRIAGKHFRLGEMLAKDSVQSRLSSDVGISFTEFSYQTLQAYDFAHLNDAMGVSLQIGGSDQWGNITAGIDYTRKTKGKQVFGLTIPLVTDAKGNKFGKSEGQSIYLDAELTSPYKMYQYLLNAEDDRVIEYLKYFTFLSLEEIEGLEKDVVDNPHLRKAQKVLSEEVVKLVHGQEGLDAALSATKIFFGGAIENISKKDLMAIFQDVPSVEVSKSDVEKGLNILDLLALTPLFKSKGDARRAVQQKGAYLNNISILSTEHSVEKRDLVDDSMAIIRRGKKNYCVVNFS